MDGSTTTVQSSAVKNINKGIEEIVESLNTETKVYDITIPVRERILDTRKRIEADFIYFAEDLYEIWESSIYMHWNYDSFRAYVEDELHIKYRRARYFVAIAQSVHTLGLNWSDIESIGWTKARILLPFLKKGTDLGDDFWLEYAEEHSVSELQTEIQKIKTAIPETTSEVVEPEVELATYTFKADAAQAQLLNDTLEHAKRMFDVNSNIEALESILYDWQMRVGTQIEALDVNSIIDWVTETYNIELEVK